MTKPQLKREMLAQLAVMMLDMDSLGAWEPYNLTPADEVRLRQACLELRDEFIRRAGDTTAFDIEKATLRQDR